MNSAQLDLIKEIFTKAEQRGIPLWLASGWAIDARLGNTIREHDDIDIVFPQEKRAEFEALLQELGCDNKQETDYGFLMYKDGIQIDTEPCQSMGTGYGFEGYPDNSCPYDKEGQLGEWNVRVVSWEGMLYKFMFFKEDVPEQDWNTKNIQNLKIVEAHVDPKRRAEIQELFNTNHNIM
jgi:aminoglycoside 2''-adenylyltransferase